MNGRPIAQYGNPQKDGPAHTVLAVTTALGQNARADAICRPYLDYLDAFIVGPSFDPWEFAVGDMFFDLNLARRALRRGARLARAHGRPDDARRYGARAGEIEEALGAFALPAEPWIRARRNLLQPFLGTISQLDIAVIGSVLTAYDVEDDVLNLDDLRVQRTMATLESACERRWPVNVAWRRSGNAGLGMGRFPEDANDGIGSTGGNPWTFATLWAAQYYFRLIQRLDFLGMEDPKGRTRADLFEQADGYLRFVLAHGSAEALTEQIDGRTGAPRGAKQLAWAQAALVQTLLIRQEISSQWRTGTPR
jgi:GH15 family glucan-1,4-alpha-glucosidase